MARMIIGVGATAAMILGVFLAAFGVWGLEAESGRRVFDEMAGLVPTYCLFAAPLVFLLGAAGLVICARR